MSGLSEGERRPPWKRWMERYWPWLLVGITALAVVFVRVRLRDMPLERDEGEYAYAGQLLLQGVPPYQLACNLKLPGTYAAYALIMAAFGQTPAGIHMGLMLVNVGSILLLFLLGRRLLDDTAGVVAALSFALLSLSPSVLGLAGHATQFVVLPALGGILLLVQAMGSAERGVRNVESLKSQVQSLKSGVGEVGHAPRFLLFLSPSSNLHPRLRLFLSGLLFGLAFLMKQHGLFFGLFGLTYLLWVRLSERWTARPDRRSACEVQSATFRVQCSTPAGQGTAAPTQPSPSAPSPRSIVASLTLFLTGLAAPYVLTCLLLWCAGVFPQFVFWTITYAAKYASAMPLARAPRQLGLGLKTVAGPSPCLWLLACVGLLVMWWDHRLGKVQSLKPQVSNPSAIQSPSAFCTPHSALPSPRFFLLSLLLCSFASVCVGFLFRHHYFITLLPVLALLSGVAASHAVYRLKGARPSELFLAVPIGLLFLLGVGGTVRANARLWLRDSPFQAICNTHWSTMFAEAARAADLIRAHTPADARIAVLGSEPEIYFLAQRRSATSQIYAYALMEPHPFARKLQEELIADLERTRPAVVVYVDDNYSWLRTSRSERRLDEWWPPYAATNLELAATFRIQEGPKPEQPDLATGQWGRPASAQPQKHLFIYRRK